MKPYSQSRWLFYLLVVAVVLLWSLPALAQPATPAPLTEPPPPAVTTPAAETPTPAPPVVSTPSTEQPRVVGIEIRGNEHISEADIRAQIKKTKVGDPFDDANVEADRVAIYGLGWFTRVEMATRAAEGGVILTYSITENEVINGVEITGVTVPKPSKQEMLALLKTKPGQVANHRYVTEDAAAIEQAYADQGYVGVQIGAPEITPEHILRINILEPKVVEVRVTGNKETKTYVITRELKTKVGSVLNINTVKKDLNRIVNLGFFDPAQTSYNFEMGPDLGTVIVIFHVEEVKKTGMITFGTGWGSVGGFMGYVEVNKNNFRGTGQRVSVRAEFGSTKAYEVGYFNPWIAPNHTSLNLAAYNRMTAREAFESSGKSFSYDERRTGGNITFGKPFGENSRGYLTLRHDTVKIENIDDSEATIDDILFKPSTVTSLKLTGVQDTRDLQNNPTNGLMHTLTLETAGLLGNGSKFNKATLDVRRYFTIGRHSKNDEIAKILRRKVLAFRLMAGTTTGQPPFLEQFLLGGSESLRGYSQDRFPGKQMLLLNSEYRFPFSDTLAGVFFVDVGDAWGGEFSEEFGDTAFKLHAAYGIGIHVQSPLGPLRLEYGIGSEGGQLGFGFGQVF
jgi:outer membrane protein insertion porin family